MRRLRPFCLSCVAVVASLPSCSSTEGEGTPANGVGDACPSGTSRCDGTCRDLSADNANCGTCGSACPDGSYCGQGTCSCPNGLSPCPGGCVDLAGDPLNCGACDTVCTDGNVCSAGACQSGCGAALTACGQSCVDLQTNPLNCGTCSTRCNSGLSCVSGTCTLGGTGGAGTGGAPTGGSATGGFAAGGAMTGGAATGGTGLGGNPTGGTTTGGIGTGGIGAGGAATGGVNTGGVVSGGTGGGSVECTTAFFSTAAASAFTSEYDSWKNCWVTDAANGTYAVINQGTCPATDTWVVSEGIGYGMLIAVGYGDQTLFDGLWQFYLDHTDSTRGLMNWSVQSTDAPGDNDSNAASDGDLDVAMALIQAEQRWGGYLSDALTLIDNIRVYETDVCGEWTILKPGDVWGGCSGDGSGNGDGKMNPSYFAPGYYRVFAHYDTANAAHWNKLANDSLILLATYQTQMSGLVPEWSYLDGSIENNYGYNACRTPWRVATDYAWFCTPEAKTFLDNVVTYIDNSGGISAVPFDKNSAFLGGFAVSGVGHSQEKIDAYVPLWLSTAQPQDTAYFQHSLRLVYLLLAGGNFPSTL